MILENVPKLIGMVYAIISLFILFYLFRKDKFNKKIGILFLVVSASMGFLIFSPMFPYQFQSLALGDFGQLGAPIPMVLLGFAIFIILTFIFGRFFCGYLCPIGAMQELVYKIPSSKIKIKNKKHSIAVHTIAFLIFLISGVVLSIGILHFFGIYDFFNLSLNSILFFIFVVVLVVSVFVYRPFCRHICPYGFLLSLTASKSMFKLRRNNNCIDCKKCEKICPTNEAGIFDLKQECYLCNRCKDVCHVNAIEYNRKEGKK